MRHILASRQSSGCGTSPQVQGEAGLPGASATPAPTDPSSIHGLTLGRDLPEELGLGSSCSTDSKLPVRATFLLKQPHQAAGVLTVSFRRRRLLLILQVALSQRCEVSTGACGLGNPGRGGTCPGHV